MTKTIVGSRNITIDDIVNIVYKSGQIELDQETVNNIDTVSTDNLKVFPRHLLQERNYEFPANFQFDIYVSRYLYLMCVYQISKGKTTLGLNILNYFVDSLNTQIKPLDLSTFISTICNDTNTYLTSPEIKFDLVETLVASLNLAVYNLSILSLRNLLVESSGIVSLLIEALQISGKKFGDEYYEKLAPHKYQIDYVLAIRVFIAVSKNLSKNQGDSTITSIPQLYGQCIDNCNNIIKQLYIDIAASYPRGYLDYIINLVGYYNMLYPFLYQIDYDLNNILNNLLKLSYPSSTYNFINNNNISSIPICTNIGINLYQFSNHLIDKFSFLCRSSMQTLHERVLERIKANEQKQDQTGDKQNQPTNNATSQKKVVLYGQGTQQLYEYLCPLLDQEKWNDIIHPFIGDLSNKIQILVTNFLSGGYKKPSVPKGTRDYLPYEMEIREKMFNIIRNTFKKHGAGEIDTPIFEEKEILMNKYGEDSKLIYDLADQGGALLSLRYDLTVPFARFLSTNSIGKIKRYHIGKVYRRDNPVLSKGRFREFYQCDYDIAGEYDTMIAESDILSAACEILLELNIGKFIFRINHRVILDGMLRLCGVPQQLYRAISSGIDKLDKETWENVAIELESKGLNQDIISNIHKYILKKGDPMKLIEELKDDALFKTDDIIMKTLDEFYLLFSYLNSMDLLTHFVFDLSLARGLDYYTGVIYEANLIDNVVGSISAGGRYDNLVGMFLPDKKTLPCVGISIGVERIYSILDSKLKEENKNLNVNKKIFVDVLVAPIGNNLVNSMKILRLLHTNNYSADIYYIKNINVKKQLAYALDNNINYMILFGDEEWNQNKVKLKDLQNRKEELILFDEIDKKLVEYGCRKLI